MATTTAIDALGRFLVLLVSDPHTTDEWRAAMGGVLGHPLFQESGRLLVDRRQADTPTTAAILAMAHFLAEHRQELVHGRIAVVVRDQAAFGMARMLEIKAQLHNPEAAMRTFRSYDDAVRWLLE